MPELGLLGNREARRSAVDPLSGRPSLLRISGIAFATGLSGAVMPGPLLVITVREALRQGAVAGPLLMVGHGLLELIAVCLLVRGAIRWARSATASGAIGLIGGAVLLWLAYGTFASSHISAGRAVSNALSVGEFGPSSSFRTIGLGAVMSMSNPFWWLWWATIGLTHITWASRQGKGASGVYFTGHLLSDVAWYTAVSLIVATGKALLLLRPAAFQVLFLICGLTLAALGFFFLRWGILHLRRRNALAV